MGPYRPVSLRFSPARLLSCMITWATWPGTCGRLQVPVLRFCLYHTAHWVCAKSPWKLISPEHSPHYFRNKGTATGAHCPTSTMHGLKGKSDSHPIRMERAISATRSAQESEQATSPPVHSAPGCQAPSLFTSHSLRPFKLCSIQASHFSRWLQPQTKAQKSQT